jgi:uncharacterized protein (DUF58 family)
VTATAREVIRKVRRLEIRTRRLVDESLAGTYHSMFRGRGVEFAEVRAYTPGDDVRTIDWNVSARMGHPFVKQFTEERELTVVLVLDVSGSEMFGTAPSTKIETAAELAALLAFAAIRNNDRVGLLLYTDRIERFLPPRKGREHGLRVLREVLAADPAGRGTGIAGALEFLQRVVRRRAVVFLISDFQDEGYDRTLRVVAQRHDLVAIALSDPRERVLPAAGLVGVEDPETGTVGVLDTGSAAVRRAYQEYADHQRHLLHQAVRHAGIDLLELSTGEPYEVPLVRFFRDRARRAARSGG